MVEVNAGDFVEFIKPIIERLSREPCRRKAVGRMRSLALEFGNNALQIGSDLSIPIPGEWRLGSYRGAWRIVQKGRVVCGSHDLVDNLQELNDKVAALQIGSVLGIELNSPHDVCVRLSDDTHIDFLGIFSDDDELFHLFGPENLFVSYSLERGWEVGRADAPT